jgi:hypothetical protein
MYLPFSLLTMSFTLCVCHIFSPLYNMRLSLSPSLMASLHDLPTYIHIHTLCPNLPHDACSRSHAHTHLSFLHGEDNGRRRSRISGQNAGSQFKTCLSVGWGGGWGGEDPWFMTRSNTTMGKGWKRVDWLRWPVNTHLGFLTIVNELKIATLSRSSCR